MDHTPQTKAAALLAVAQKHLDAGEPELARPILERILAFAPDDAPALALFAGLAARQSAATRPALSVVVPAGKRLEAALPCLRRLEAQTLPPERFEALVVTEAGEDAASAFLAGYAPRFALRLLRQSVGDGPARARNVGIRAARGDLVVFIGEDTLLDPQALAVHLEVQQAVPDVAYSVLGRCDFPEDFAATVWGAVLQHSDLVRDYGSLEHNSLASGETRYFARNVSTPRRALLAAGLFDEHFTGPRRGCEDLELGRRLMGLPTPVPVLFRDDCRATSRGGPGVDELADLLVLHGGAAAWMAAKSGDRDAPCGTVTAADAAYWRKLPRRLLECMEALCALLRQTENARMPVAPDSQPPRLRREDEQALAAACRGLPALRTRELLELAQGALALAQGVVADSAARRGSLWDAARALYPACLFFACFQQVRGACGAQDAAPGSPGPDAQAVRNPGSPRGRLLLACNFFWPSVGGTELLVEHLGEQLLDAGYEVDVACRHLDARSVLTRKGMRIHQFRCQGRFFDASMGPDARAYQRHVAAGGYKAVIALAHPDNWSCHLLTDLPSPRPRRILMPSINAENMHTWEQYGVMPAIRRTLAAADALIAVSQSGQDRQVFERLGLPHAFIPHAVDNAAAPGDMRARYAFDPARPLLACVGNFWPVKNQAALLEIMAQAPGDWQLALAGAALPWSAELAFFDRCWELARADPRLRLLGPLPPLEAAALIREADVLLVPSLGESAGPLVLLQAMSFATPWVATPQCNAVGDEAGGLTVELARFPEAIGALLQNPDAAAALGALGREHWRTSFTWESSLPLFLDLIEGRPPSRDLEMPAALRVRQTALAGILLPPRTVA